MLLHTFPAILRIVSACSTNLRHRECLFSHLQSSLLDQWFQHRTLWNFFTKLNAWKTVVVYWIFTPEASTRAVNRSDGLALTSSWTLRKRQDKTRDKTRQETIHDKRQYKTETIQDKRQYKTRDKTRDKTRQETRDKTRHETRRETRSRQETKTKQQTRQETRRDKRQIPMLSQNPRRILIATVDSN